MGRERKAARIGSAPAIQAPFALEAAGVEFTLAGVRRRVSK
jgi:hypothetical protein